MNPKRSADYVARQKLLRVNSFGPEAERNRQFLEKKFMRAWKFAPDRARQGPKLLAAIASAVEDWELCFDHCCFYRDTKTWGNVIVTQPHFDPTNQLNGGALRLGNWAIPEVIPAHDWSYAPASGFLVIAKFPHGYGAAVKAVRRALGI